MINQLLDSISKLGDSWGIHIVLWSVAFFFYRLQSSMAKHNQSMELNALMDVIEEEYDNETPGEDEEHAIID